MGRELDMEIRFSRPRDAVAQQPDLRAGRAPRGGIICWWCQRRGHKIATCYARKAYPWKRWSRLRLSLHCTSLEEEKKHLQQKLYTMEQNHLKNAEKREQLERRLESANMDTETKNARIKELEKGVKSLHDKLKRKSQQNAQQVEQLQKDIAQTQKEKTESMMQCERRISEMTVTLEKHLELLVQKDETIEELHTENAQLNAATQDKESSVRDMRDESRCLQQQLSALRTEMEELEKNKTAEIKSLHEYFAKQTKLSKEQRSRSTEKISPPIAIVFWTAMIGQLLMNYPCAGFSPHFLPINDTLGQPHPIITTVTMKDMLLAKPYSPPEEGGGKRCRAQRQEGDEAATGTPMGFSLSMRNHREDDVVPSRDADADYQGNHEGGTPRSERAAIFFSGKENWTNASPSFRKTKTITYCIQTITLTNTTIYQKTILPGGMIQAFIQKTMLEQVF